MVVSFSLAPDLRGSRPEWPIAALTHAHDSVRVERLEPALVRFHRHVGLWRIAADNVIRHRGKSLAIALPLSVVIAVFGAITFIKDGLSRDAELSAELLPDVTVQKTVGGRVERMPMALIPELGNLPHVSSIAPRVWGYLPIEFESEAFAYTIMGLDLERAELPEGAELLVREGRFIEAGERGKCVIGNAVSAGLNAGLGDRISLGDLYGNEDAFEVVGVFETSVQIYASDLILTDIDTAREFFGYMDDEASDVSVYLDDSAYADRTAAAIQEMSPELRVLSKETLREVMLQAYGGRGGIFQLIWLVLLLTAGLIAWSQASHISLDRKHEVGILKAIGWETLDVIELAVIEATILGLLAAFCGIVLALAYVLADAPGMKSYFLGWATVYPQFPMPLAVTARSMTVLLAICIVPLWLAVVVPCWLLGVVEPDSAIRG